MLRGISWVLVALAVMGQEVSGGVGSALPDLEARDLAVDREHFQALFRAIEAYRKDHAGAYPDWLSDLFPGYLTDTNLLMSPVELRTGQSQLYGNDDPRLHTSYIYEFNPNPTSAYHVPDRQTAPTQKEWKLKQMERFGDAVPVVRCLLHPRPLNLAVSGDIFQTELFWESDPNTLALMERLGVNGTTELPTTPLVVRVVDRDANQPVAGASVSAAHIVETGYQPVQVLTTSERGECTVQLTGELIRNVQVRAQSPGYVPGRVEWAVEGGVPLPKVLEIPLTRGMEVGGDVRDATGRPVAGVAVRVRQVMAFSLRNLGTDPTEVLPARETVTDDGGQWSLGGMPADLSLLAVTVARAGYREGDFSTLGTLPSPGVEFTVKALKQKTARLVLLREARVLIEVTDAVSGEAVPEFSLLPAYRRGRTLAWDPEAVRVGKRGRAEWTVASSESGFPRVIRVDAPGYASGWVQLLRDPVEDREERLTLEKGSTAKGEVIGPDGMKTAGVVVASIGALDEANLTVPGLEPWPGWMAGLAAADGRFEVPLGSTANHWMASGEAGYFETWRGAGDFRLAAWGRLEGSLPVSASGSGFAPVVFLARGPLLPNLLGQPTVGWLGLSLESFLAEADDQGRFNLPQVPPGRWVLWNPVLVDDQRPPIPSMMSFNGRWVDVPAGETCEVELRGASLRGQLTLALSTPIDDWTRCLGALRLTRDGQPPLIHFLTFSRLGEFRLQGIPAGEYAMELRVYEAPRLVGIGKRRVQLGEGEDAGRSAPVVVKLVTARPGAATDAAPDFETEPMEGGSRFRLADHRGHYVLLHFWTSWSGATLASAPYLREAVERAGDGGRLEVVSVNVDEGPYGAEALVGSCGWPGRETQGPSWLQSSVLNDFGVTGLPALVLVDPAGRIAATDLWPEQVLEALAQSMP